MKIQIYSDLHLDINHERPFSLPDSDTFTILCGDISAYPDETVKWINENIKNGVFVEGNHIGYNTRNSIQYIQHKLSEQFPIDANVSYLYDTHKVIGDYVFVGGILWTDYKLNGEEFRTYNMSTANIWVNDYKYNHYYIGDSTVNPEMYQKALVRKLIPKNCETMFYRTLNAIKIVCEMYPDKKIIVVTHHAPSMKSISERYVRSESSYLYASSLEQFIVDHPNIKLWCHGHIHTNSNYMIGDCRIICNPRGYEYKYVENLAFDSHCIIDI